MTISTIRGRNLPFRSHFQGFLGRSNELGDGRFLSTDCRPDNPVVFRTQRRLRGSHFLPSHSQTAEFAVLQLRVGLQPGTHESDQTRIEPIASDDRLARVLETTCSKEFRP